MGEERNLLTSVKGINGQADVYEVYTSATSMPHYEVKYQNQVVTFQSEGEASMLASELVS
ncbi:MAG: hypothetical protein MK127_07720 [Dehalococcoidia bacterium]|jgi:protoporphyrinogen oxidase|nr:hypothetical protein [Dehalococcoidia bacterium]